jgi:hypothetical protein
MDDLPLTHAQREQLLKATLDHMQELGAMVCTITFRDTPAGDYRLDIDHERGTIRWSRLLGRVRGWRDRLHERWETIVEGRLGK